MIVFSPEKRPLSDFAWWLDRLRFDSRELSCLIDLWAYSASRILEEPGEFGTTARAYEMSSGDLADMTHILVGFCGTQEATAEAATALETFRIDVQRSSGAAADTEFRQGKAHRSFRRAYRCLGDVVRSRWAKLHPSRDELLGLSRKFGEIARDLRETQNPWMLLGELRDAACEGGRYVLALVVTRTMVFERRWTPWLRFHLEDYLGARFSNYAHTRSLGRMSPPCRFRGLVESLLICQRRFDHDHGVIGRGDDLEHFLFRHVFVEIAAKVLPARNPVKISTVELPYWDCETERGTKVPFVSDWIPTVGDDVRPEALALARCCESACKLLAQQLPSNLKAELADTSREEDRVLPSHAQTPATTAPAGASSVDSSLQGLSRSESEQASAPAQTPHDNKKLKAVVRQQLKAEIKSHLTDVALIAAYQQHGSYRAAAQALSSQQGTKVSKDRVCRAVQRAGGVQAMRSDKSSQSVVRTVASQGRVTRKKTPNDD